MRIKCSVDVHNRACTVAGVATSCKPMHSQVSIGKKPGSSKELFIMIATTKDLNGRKFGLNGNVLRVFTKCLQDGKATIQLKDPPFDIRLSKADIHQLKTFLLTLKSAHEGKELDKSQVSMLAPSSTKAVEKPTERLCILNKKDYPLTTGFPSSLTTLEIRCCKLSRVDRRIMALQHLRCLDLSDNALRQLPQECGKLTQLRELRLEKNELTEFPASLCQGEWKKSLKVLNLSSNKFEGCSLPLQFGELINLVNLAIDSNQFTALPPSIGQLRYLRRLSVANNNLQIFPASVLKLRLETLDVSNNDFVTVTLNNNEEINLDPNAWKNGNNCPTLLEIAGNFILHKAIPFNPEIIPRQLCWYLQYFAKRCFCGRFCFESAWRAQAPLDPSHISQTCSNTTDGNGGRLPILAFLCSRKCFLKFKKNPLAFSI